MSYSAAIEQLNAMVPELYAHAGQPRRKFSLEELRILLGALGEPQRRFPAVLIAGTNGKGSTASTLASILTVSGVRAGLYTSPHLERPNERIRLNGAEISDEAFAKIYFRAHDEAERLVLSGRLPQPPSFFEMLTAQAFLYFAENKVELAVLEVGMGGRLDATNVADPLLSLITDISLDHTEWLGSTISAITREKAGILRPGGTLITLPQHPEANQVLGEVAAELDVRGVSAVPYMPPIGTSASEPYKVEALGGVVEVDSPLKGTHQHRNLALAIAAAVELAQTHGFPVTPAAITQGIHQTRWPGRLERLQQDGVEWILDVAHNPAGAWALRTGLNSAPASERSGVVVFACLRDKPVVEMAQILFPLFKQVVVAPIHSPRAADMETIVQAAESTGTHAVVAGSVAEALEMARKEARRGAEANPLVVISGSIYLVGEARVLLLKDQASVGGMTP
jgi:dihydrofolate synthase / folylpolyglutamate synthase